MRHTKSLTTSIIAITFAMMFTATIPFYQQEVYAIHKCLQGFTPVHIGGAPAGCIPEGSLQDECDQGVLFDECKSLEPLPLNERYPNQGTCIDAGEDKDACKAAFKADKKNQ
jgi:hypothetical protein